MAPLPNGHLNNDDDLASISNSSCYFESNCELFYIENDGVLGLEAQALGEMTFNKNNNNNNINGQGATRIITQKKKAPRKVKELSRVAKIEDHYKISYKYADVLGNGAFGTVRICSKAGSKDSQQ